MPRNSAILLLRKLSGSLHVLRLLLDPIHSHFNQSIYSQPSTLRLILISSQLHMFPKWCLSPQSFFKNVKSVPIPYACYISRSFYPYSNNTNSSTRRVEIMNFSIVQLPPSACLHLSQFLMVSSAFCF
jgi:hypothetical protein